MMSKLNIPELRFPEFSGEWEEKKLKEITTKIGSGKTPRGGSSVYKKEGIPFLRSQNVQFGALKLDDLVFIDDETDEGMKNSRSYFGDVLLNITGASIGRACMNTLKNTHSNLNQHVSIIRLDSQNSPYFIEQFLISTKGQRSIFRAQSGGSREGLNFAEIGKLKIKLPRIDEQEKIGSFFSKVDRLIELEEKKLELLEEQKKGYMQKIFSQELRFKDENGNDYPEWEERKLGELLGERVERSASGELLSVTISEGIKPFSQLDRKNNSSDNKDNYKKVCVGDIAYNSMRMWQGASGYSTYEGIVSPAYTVLYKKSEIDMEFMSYYFKTHQLVHTFKKFSQGLTSDTWNLKYPLLKTIPVYICSLNEQKKISAFFVKLDYRISQQRIKVNKLNFEKQGLLQRMFV